MPLSPLARKILDTIRKDPVNWAISAHISLRPYQRQIALAIKDSIIRHAGRTFVVILPRQSGKNELQAHLFAWLLFRAANSGGRIVSVSPTFKPQTYNSMDRVAASLDASLGTRGLWQSSNGFIYRFGKSRLQFFSGDSSAKVVGATADLLLSVDEAQQISPAKFDKDFDPMTASANATRVFWGTAWTSDTLLERQRRLASQDERQDGIQRVFFYTADDVRRLVPQYGRHVDRKVAEQGRDHPLVKTQYFCETIDAQSGLFNAARLALIQSDRPFLNSPPETGGAGGGSSHAFLIDVAGMDEALLSLDGLGNPGRDSTTLSIVEIDLSTLETLQRPTYRVVARHAWQGQNHLSIFGQLKNLAQSWRPQYLVIDATGVGEGLWAMLDKAFPTRVIPVKFTGQEKSEIGWRFLAIIETGRFRDCAPNDTVRLQYDKCRSEILPGPSKTLRWGVPDGTRGPAGELVHDDFVIADSLTAILDRLEWHIHFETLIIPGIDPLIAIDRGF
jgi:hypothetical protein